MLQDLLHYIVFLHQTTTIEENRKKRDEVALYRLSTSNHNINSQALNEVQLHYIVFLHQTTTYKIMALTNETLHYIVFLHQTTTLVSLF